MTMQSTSLNHSFQVTPESIIEESKHLFLSEDFARSIMILQECIDVDVNEIISLLKGEIGYKIDGSEVEFGKEFINKEYSQMISEVLESYDFLINHLDTVYQIKSSVDFDLSAYADTSDWIINLKESEGKLISVSGFKYFDEIKSIMEENSCYQFDDAHYFLYYDKSFYVFCPYTYALIEEVIKFYDKPVEAATAFKKNLESYSE